MKKYFTQLNIIFALEVIVVALAASGLIPREAILVWTGLAIFYMIFSPLEDSLWLVIASIPLGAALPLYETFDTLASWRILILVLFGCLFFKKDLFSYLRKTADRNWSFRDALKSKALIWWVAGFLLIALLSIGVASYKIIALKKLIFLLNILILFLIVKYLTRRRPQDILRVWRAALTGGVVVAFVALIQFLAVLFIPLYNFWEFWAEKVITAFYGEGLSNLLSYSNTWFAYYSVNPPTLRLFSVFPDSHSFAMFNILLLPISLVLFLYYKDNRRLNILLKIMIVLSFFGIVMSGSRGAWLSIVPVFLAAIYFYRQRIDESMVKKALQTLTLFIIFFVLSVGYPPVLYTFQSWQTGNFSSSTFSFFERAKSISNLEETSNKGRIEIWQASLRSVAAHPLLGVGLGNYVVVLDEKVSAVKKGASAHNLYLDFASEIGIIGALFLIGIFWEILYTSWLVWRCSKELYFRFFGLLFGLYLFWVLGYSFFDVVLLNDKVLLLFVVSAATLYSLRDLAAGQQKIDQL
ncbi:MAG: O-antigen ligase family protein [Patescibacteria group bacterium]